MKIRIDGGSIDLTGDLKMVGKNEADFLEMMNSDNPTIVAERERLMTLWRIVKS